jgi:DNA-binding transcriptional LysR family regulator
MHRYLHRLAGQPPAFSYSTDGAEMGKLLVAAGLGVTVLPDFSVIGDPLERSGVITWRPLDGDSTLVRLVMQRTRAGSPPRAARDLHRIFVARAGDCQRRSGPAAGNRPAGPPGTGLGGDRSGK